MSTKIEKKFSLSNDIKKIINVRFSSFENSSYVLSELENVYNFYAKFGEFISDRVYCSVLKLSGNSLEKFNDAVKLAKIDWRDLFVAANFANDIKGHEKWLLKELEKNESK